MDVFWIRLLAILVLFLQTSTCEKSSIRDGTVVVAAAGVSDTVVVTGAVGSSVILYFNNSTDGKAALLSSEKGPIATMSLENHADTVIHNDKFKDRVAVSVKGHAFNITILQLRMEDAGNYSVKINGKTYTFTLQVFTVTTHPPSPGADSGNSVWIPLTVIGIGVLVIVLIFLAFRYKSKVPCMRGRLRGRDGRQGDSHGAAGDMDTEAEVFV